MKPLHFPFILILFGLAFTQCKSTSPITYKRKSHRTTPTKAPVAAALFHRGNAAPSSFALSSADDTARFLAGLPGERGSPYASLRRTGAWMTHQREMDRMFGYFAQSREGAIRSWRTRELGGLGSNLVFYPFGGPDYLFAHTFFPKANRYVLVGLEGADPLPSSAGLHTADLSATLGNLRQSIKSVVYHSYFITKDMRADLAGGALQGTLPPILVFMARTGHRIRGVNLIDLSSTGIPVGRTGGGAAPGIHVVAQGPSGGTKHVYYFREDLSNSGLGNDQRLLRFVTRQSAPTTFLKSASYLMHGDHFSIIRNAILNQSLAVVTDPSGMPFHALASGNWDIKLYGNYTGTLDMFREHYQPDLAASYQNGRHPVRPMPFGVGYKQTSLIVARRTALRAMPLARR